MRNKQTLTQDFYVQQNLHHKNEQGACICGIGGKAISWDSSITYERKVKSQMPHNPSNSLKMAWEKSCKIKEKSIFSVKIKWNKQMKSKLTLKKKSEEVDNT